MIRLAALMFLLCLRPVAAIASWTGVYAYVDWTTDYRFYGMSSSNRQPIVRGGLHWTLSDYFYLGVFASGVRFEDFRNTSYELDFYGGHHFYFDSNDLNFQLLYSMFPNQAGHAFYKPRGYVFPTYNFGEASAELSHKIDALTLSGKLIFSPSYGSGTGDMGGADAAAS